MERPRILVTTSTEFRDEDVRRRDSTTGSNYSEGVIRAGGLRFMVANLDPGLVDTYLDNVDGVLFTGGVDLDPDSYGQQPARGLGKVDPQRDA
ncbi:MAG: gamma-glutamyl-gamma-aminobutyrate hydrolase family protein [Trueperaceae bacterium]